MCEDGDCVGAGLPRRMARRVYDVSYTLPTCLARDEAEEADLIHTQSFLSRIHPPNR